MTNSEVAALVVERLQALNLGLDLSEGGWVWNTVVNPIMARLGLDPVDSEARAFVRAHLQAAHPDMAVDQAGAAYTAFATDIAQILLNPVRFEILTARRRRSLKDPSALTEEEYDDLLAALLEDRELGDYAWVDIRAFFKFPQPVWVDGSVYGVTASGLRFYADQPRTYASEQMIRLGTEYYIEFRAVAAAPGRDYNIDRDSIINVVGIPAITRATNPRAAQGGLPRETNEDVHRRLPVAVSERVPLTDYGIQAHVRRMYPEATAVRTVGYGHPEMRRDIIKGQAAFDEGALGLGPVIVEGIATAEAESYSGLPAADFTRKLSVGGSPPPSLSGVSPGDRVHVARQDRPVQAIGADCLYVDDYLSICAGATGATKVYHVTRGAELPVTPILEDAAAGFSAVAPGHQVVLAASGEFRKANLRDVYAVPSSSQLRTETLPSLKMYCSATIDVGATGGNAIWYLPPSVPFDLSTAHSIVEIAAPVVGPELAHSADIVARNDADRVLYLGAPYVGTSKYADSCWIRVKNAGGDTLGELQLDVPGSMSPGCITGSGSVRNLHISSTASDYNFNHPPAGMRPVVTGDWVALVQEVSAVTRVLYGLFQVVAVSDQYLQLAVGWPAATGGALPGTESTYRWSWAVLDGSELPDAAALAAAFFPATTLSSAGLSQTFLVISRSARSLASSYNLLDPETDISVPFSVRGLVSAEDVDAQLRLTISDVPGGLLNPDSSVVIEDDEVHVGGDVDAHLQGTIGTDVYDLSELEDDDPLVRGTDLIWAVDTDAVYSVELTDPALGDLAGKVLVIEEGPQAAPYRILSGPSGGWVVIDSALDSAEVDGARFYVTERVSTELTAPTITKVARTRGLATSIGPYVKFGVPGAWKNFSDYGVVPEEDVLEILEGADEGVHVISAVAEGGLALKLNHSLTWEANDLLFRIYKPLSALQPPLVRVRRVDVLEDGAETGVVVPLADPVDVRSGELSNAGLGLKVPNALRTSPTATLSAGGVLTDASADFRSDSVVPGDLVVVGEGDNQGPYIIGSVPTDTSLVVEGAAWPIEPAVPVVGVSYAIGAASTGSARCRFLTPTFFEVGPDARFSDDAGHEFRPDVYGRALLAEFSWPDGFDLSASGADLTSAAAGVDFRQYGLKSGDLVSILSREISGAVVAGAEANVVGAALVLQFVGSPQKTVRFIGTNPLAFTAAGYPGGVREQLEAAFPDLTVEVSGNALVFHSSAVFTLIGGSAATALGLSALVGGTNVLGSGEYSILSVAAHQLVLREYPGGATPTLPASSGVNVRIERLRAQRIGPAAMAQNIDDNGFYYVDIDIMSVRPGNEHNLVNATRLTVDGHLSYGYRLSSLNEALTFSPSEQLAFQVTPYLMAPDRQDRPDDLVMLPGKQLRFTIDVDAAVRDVNIGLRRSSERIVTTSPLAKHFRPAFVYAVLRWAQGPTEDVLRTALQSYLSGAAESGVLRPYDIYQVMDRLGARRVQTPVEIVALVHETDRTIRTYRSTSEVVLADPVRVVELVEGFQLVRA